MATQSTQHHQQQLLAAIDAVGLELDEALAGRVLEALEAVLADVESSARWNGEVSAEASADADAAPALDPPPGSEALPCAVPVEEWPGATELDPAAGLGHPVDDLPPGLRLEGEDEAGLSGREGLILG